MWVSGIEDDDNWGYHQMIDEQMTSEKLDDQPSSSSSSNT